MKLTIINKGGRSTAAAITHLRPLSPTPSDVRLQQKTELQRLSLRRQTSSLQALVWAAAEAGEWMGLLRLYVIIIMYINELS